MSIYKWKITDGDYASTAMHDKDKYAGTISFSDRFRKIKILSLCALGLLFIAWLIKG